MFLGHRECTAVIAVHCVCSMWSCCQMLLADKMWLLTGKQHGPKQLNSSLPSVQGHCFLVTYRGLRPPFFYKNQNPSSGTCAIPATMCGIRNIFLLPHLWPNPGSKIFGVFCFLAAITFLKTFKEINYFNSFLISPHFVDFSNPFYFI